MRLALTAVGCAVSHGDTENRFQNPRWLAGAAARRSWTARYTPRQSVRHLTRGSPWIHLLDIYPDGCTVRARLRVVLSFVLPGASHGRAALQSWADAEP